MRRINIIKDGKTPHTNSEWFEIAPPEKGEKQWKPYHSASELADYFLHYEKEVPPEIDELLTELNISSNDFIGIPEHQTPFPADEFGEGGPRHHDLLLVAKDNEVVIGIEAKATESLDKDVNKYKLDTENRKKRYGGICEAILNQPIDKCDGIKYQLLSATLGTLLETKDTPIKKAILLVLLFDSKIVPPKHIEATKKDIKRFTDMLSPKGEGPYHIPYMPDIDFYVKFINVPVCSYCDKK